MIPGWMCIGKRMVEVFASIILIGFLRKCAIEEFCGTGEMHGQRVLTRSLTSPMAGGLSGILLRSESLRRNDQAGRSKKRRVAFKREERWVMRHSLKTLRQPHRAIPD